MPAPHPITPAQLKEWLEDGRELALLDVRDEAGFAKGHPLFATNVPADRLLRDIDRFVPRKAVRTVLIDGGDGAAERLAHELAETGWPLIHWVQGGTPAWEALGAGLPTFDTSGRDFSLAIRAEKGTPVLTAEELKAARDRGEDVVVIDTRTLPEFTRAHVPGAVGVPAAELLLRFADVVPSARTKVVVSCAGLPRAILGAQTLIDAGVPNEVVYLDDGTAGWTRAGLQLEEGATRTFGPASDAGREAAQGFLDSFADSIPEVDEATARGWQADPGRTTYLLDVRTPAEFAAGHLPGTVSSEGGQLVAVSHRTIAVRGARVVLIDDLDGVRARTTAHWLQRRGFEIAILRYDFQAARSLAQAA
ncbi:rhodanese-like domain-containing protein [Xylophilus sp.]|uniref:rhodanese-like domain-containing protein n=1 Tax=Xylophilus sp. TaxID=2653893 RepID=UPI0013B7E9CD|nr:rhodanese-like domain-containing protein [Xylophilus sp.]KAF1047154.1 MAG: Thiosulfate sulfurtransferase GlpE [Xylophilus sp.]